MLLVDKEIKELINEGILKNANAENIGAISYDLIIDEIICTSKPIQKCTQMQLEPHEVVFISCKVDIFLRDDLVAFVEERNSRIRQGLFIDAPVYQPGHKTKVFFRVQNVSGDRISLKRGDSIAAIRFERLDTKPEKIYDGAFVNEFDFRYLGNYENTLKLDVEKADKKIKDMEQIEKSIYGNVMTLMTIFIGIFSLLSLNIDFLKSREFDAVNLLVYNLVIIGALGLFAALISLLLPRNKINKWQFIIPVLLLVAALLITLV